MTLDGRPVATAPAPKRPLGDLPWWQSTTVYHIYPRSFSDSNGDGIGDLAGIIDKLDYLQRLGVETLWISPFFSSPQADFGYDISDHLDIAPEYGTVADCLALIAAVHARGMKIIFDMVLNHTSNQHPWFLESRRSRESSKRDYYLWRRGRGRRGDKAPNNWRSMLGPSGWHRDEPTGDWYWASFLPFQPDLNYRHPEVKRAMLGVVRHWLDLGVDGLRLDLFNAIFKSSTFEDNPGSFRPFPSPENPHGFFQTHTGTIDHPDTLAFARELRTAVDEVLGRERFLVGEVFGDAKTLRRYCGEVGDAGLHLVFLFQTLQTRFDGRAVRALIAGFEREFPAPLIPTYVLGNHDRPRLMDRLGGNMDKAKLLATLQLTARGVPFLYYGDEIGTGHHEIPLVRGLDPVATRFRSVPQRAARAMRRFGILLNRDECRLPMSWTAGPNAGFSVEASVPWLPVHPRHTSVNVAAQESNPTSLLCCYQRLLALRARTPALHSGRLQLLFGDGLDGDVVGFRRTSGEGSAASVADVFLNFSREAQTIDAGKREGWAVHSSRDDEPREAARTLRLAPNEGVVLIPVRRGALSATPLER
ncbi:MAG: alpha-amylase family glycosyl hydrolase [Polyangiales bacterium]